MRGRRSIAESPTRRGDAYTRVAGRFMSAPGPSRSRPRQVARERPRRHARRGASGGPVHILRPLVAPLDRLQRRLLTALALALGTALVAAPAAFAGVFTPEHGGSPNANSINVLYWMVMILAIIIFVGVEGALLYSLFKFRARKGRVAAQIHGNTRLEIGWTVGAAVILVFISTFTFIKLPAIKNPPASLIDANGRPVATGDNVAFASTDPIAPPSGASMTIHVD